MERRKHSTDCASDDRRIHCHSEYSKTDTVSDMTSDPTTVTSCNGKGIFALYKSVSASLVRSWEENRSQQIYQRLRNRHSYPGIVDNL
ncbi:hypothetical protein PoB_003682300 [Plakobranchus ocellatus]|uniref:Uncharacterized protein n=1 Tax=Plakobranchus ocellatus TaxID=259542 RepID=A0AAV4AUT6_9GAST|nr:hypothetical protein PoB_003682300 [Plakobranchus ocellatus]